MPKQCYDARTDFFLKKQKQKLQLLLRSWIGVIKSDFNIILKRYPLFIIKKNFTKLRVV